MNLIPRVTMTPNISKDAGKLLSYCFVKSPAPNILVNIFINIFQGTSITLILTLHQDCVLRLWTTDDGRCILASRKDILPKLSPQVKITLKVISSENNTLSGIVALSSSEMKEIYIVNAYKMTVVKKIPHNIEGLTSQDNLKLSIHESFMIL